MASVKLRHIYKVYPNGVKAVNDFDMDIEDKEFIVFVGPSGCGKSTTLRMIAGLEEISAGELKIDGKLVNDVEPKDRDIAMVFQNYALYPHMTVFNNIAFSLKLAKIPKEERIAEKALLKDGKKLNIIDRFFGRTLMEERDVDGNILYDENGNVKYVTKKNKDGSVKHDKNGSVVYHKRGYTLDELYGPVKINDFGDIVYVTKKDKDGQVILDKDGKPVYNRRKYKKYEIRQMVYKAADILGISDYLDRKPAAMSGGQRQRVALGRAIVRHPKVFLLDEPLSNLDAKLRTAMRSEISKLHQKLQTTFIYVTHDQIEAMTMGTRIVVMKDGFVQQIDSPINLYKYPCNKFVAGFIGTPQMNFFAGKIKSESENVDITFDGTNIDISAPVRYFLKASREFLGGEKPVVFGIRAEHISSDPKQYPYTAKCRITHVEEFGVDCQVYADFNAHDDDKLIDSSTRVIFKAPTGWEHKVGDIVEISIDVSHLHIFDAESERTVMPRIPAETIVPSQVKNNVLYIWDSELKLPPAISLDDGEYQVHVPTSAVSLGGDIKTAFYEEEDVNGQRLITLKAKFYPVFVIDGQKEKSFKKDEAVGISVDFAQLTFKQVGETKLEALNSDNVLPCRLTMHREVKEVVENGATIKKAVVSFTIDICGKAFICPEKISEKLLAAGGRKICNSELAVHFSPEHVKIAEDGISAQVVRMLDYGDKKYAEFFVDGHKVNMAVSDDVQGNVMLALDLDEVAIFEPELDVRIV